MSMPAPPTARGRRGRASPIGLSVIALLLCVGSANAYVNPRLYGSESWLPPSVRTPNVLGSLHPAPREARLSAGEKKIREEYEVDLETGRVRVRQTYGKTILGPEYVDDLTTGIRAANRRAVINQWKELVRREREEAMRTADDSSVEIDIPVEFPDALADVIGQGARLNLTGSERITFSGTSNIIEGGPRFESQRSSAFPDLDMRQQLRVNLDGTIGRKIHVLLNHDSEANTDLSNKIQLRYDGDEDEVVQKIEMGNTELALPGSEFLSFRKSQQGLFGAKAIAKFGPLDFTAIASKQEGKTERQTFVGQARRDSVSIRDTEFVKRKFFWIADPLALADSSQGILPIRTIEVFLDDKQVTNDRADGALPGFAFRDARTQSDADSSGKHVGHFHRLTADEDYAFNYETGTLTLSQSVSTDHALACFFVTARGDTVGNTNSTSALFPEDPRVYELQALAPPQGELFDDAKGFQPIRALEQKNIYSLLARNVILESFRIIRKAVAAGEQELDAQQEEGTAGAGTPYIQILGLDTKGEGTAAPDGLIDPEFFNDGDGTITFPNITPFAPDSSVVNVIVSPLSISTGRSTEPGVKLQKYNAGLYTREPTEFFNSDVYRIVATFTTPTPTYSLNRFNILEGSERVHLDGRLLSKGADYDIDYELGILTFKQEIKNTDPKIEVDFEYVPLFGQAKESLAGVSSTYNFNPQTRLSSSWLYYSKASPELRPRLGQEPSRILVGNLFGQWLENPDVLTEFIDAVPLVSTEEKSEVSIQGEVAMSVPNPNTKDEIYIDDMEGVEDSRDLTISRVLWTPAAEPVGPVSTDLDLDRRNIPRFPFNWYNPDNVVRRKEVFPELVGQQEGEDFLQVLEFAVREEEGSQDPERWMGIQRNLSVTGEDFSQKKFLEIWINDFGQRQGNVVFDLGDVSEDAYVDTASPDSTKGRGFLDTEDQFPLDGQIQVSTEDLGLDGVRGEDGTGVAGDDGNDDHEFRNTANPDFSRINGTEGNSLLDTEDLDNDNLLDTQNTYFSYVLDLADSVVVKGQRVPNPFIVQDNGQLSPGNTWRLFQIPLIDGVSVGGVPRLRAAKYARLWFDGLPTGFGKKAQIASLKIVGAAWLEEKLSTNDTVEPVDDSPNALFTIKDVNNKEDAVYAGEEPFDPGVDSNGLKRREQSLMVDYLRIPSSAPTTGGTGRQGSAYKEILDTGGGKNQDFTQYETMSFYLRDGQRLFQKADRPDTSDGTFFLRFGPDTTNFYEFATPVSSRIADWNEIRIQMNDLAELKLIPPQSQRVVEGVPVSYRSSVVNGDTLAVYGEPSLTRVRRLTLGVRGDLADRSEVNGILWVNEFRLRSVKRDPGYASRVSGTARLADFINLSSSVRKIDSEFRRIDGDRLGNDDLTWNAQGVVNLNKLVDGRGLSLPVTVDLTSSRSTPRLSPNSDIELEDEKDRRDAQSTSRGRQVSARLGKTRPSTRTWMRYTLDNISLSMTDSENKSNSPFQRSVTNNTSGQMTYNLNPGQGKTLRLLKRFDFSYFPSLRMGMNGALNLSDLTDVQRDSTGARVEIDRAQVRRRNLDGTMSTSWDPLRSGSFDSQLTFNKTQAFDLHKQESLVESVQLGGREEKRDHTSRFNWRPNVVRWLRPVLSYDTRYNEDRGPNAQSPEIDLRLRHVNNAANREVSATFSLRQLLPKQSSEPKKRASRGRSDGSSWSGNPDEPQVEPENLAPPPSSPPPGNREKAPGDSSAASPGDSSSAPADSALSTPRRGPPKLPSLSTIASKAFGLLSSFGDIRYTYGDRRNSSYTRVGGRPDFAYQYGFGKFDRGLIVTGANAALANEDEGQTYSSKFDTTFQPSSAFFLDTHYLRTTTKTAQRDQRSKREETVFPDVSVTLEGLERHGFLKRLSKSSTMNSSYRHSSSVSGKLAPPDAPLPEGQDWFDKKQETREFSPLASWSSNWNSGVSTTVSYNRRTTEDESRFTGSVNRTKDFSHGFKLNGRYSFSAPKGVAFLGKKIRFRSDMTLTFDVERTEDKQEETVGQIAGQLSTSVRAHKKSISFKPRATYNFSKKIQGSLDLGYSRSRDLQLERNNTTISVAVEALIKF